MNNLSIHTITVIVSTVFDQEAIAGNETADLGPLFEPDVISFSFDTVGWKLISCLLVVLVVWKAGVQLWKYYKDTYRREALKELLFLDTHFVQEQNREFVNASNVLLKQVAMSVYGREEVASLYGTEWIGFLDSRSTETNFLQFGSLFYRSSLTKEEVLHEDRLAIFTQTKKWIQTHAR